MISLFEGQSRRGEREERGGNRPTGRAQVGVKEHLDDADNG
jgi:hypothetical protein